MERICKCGIGHPDPDHMAWLEEAHGKAVADVEAVHGCCGCCGCCDPNHKIPNDFEYELELKEFGIL